MHSAIPERSRARSLARSIASAGSATVSVSTPARSRCSARRAAGIAAAFGRPIVATDVPGCREIARHDVNAFLVPPDDPVALADAIAVLARDPALRARLGAAGRAMVETEFSSARIGAEIVALYETLSRLRPALLPGTAAAS